MSGHFVWLNGAAWFDARWPTFCDITIVNQLGLWEPASS